MSSKPTKRALKISKDGITTIVSQPVVVRIELTDEQRKLLGNALNKQMPSHLDLTSSELLLLFNADEHDKTVGASV
ncbi:MAG: hypothetical protein GY930_21605 [bacterium]|nr:hypothetical protein [bacterium]